MLEGDQPTHRLRANAQHGPLRGETDAANELAGWLRKLAGRRSLRQLEQVLPYGRTQLGWFFNGRKLINEDLLDDIVTALVPQQQNRPAYKARGLELLKAAKEAEEALRTAGSPAPSGATARDYEMRLADALQGQLDAQATVHSLERLIRSFEGAMSALDQRCRNLETEWDQARQHLQQETGATTANQQRAAENKKRATEAEQRLAQAEQRLAEFEQRQVKFEEKLARAQWEKQQAEDLQRAASEQAEHNRHAFEQLTGQEAPTQPVSEEAYSEPVLQRQPWEYDRILEMADEELDRHRDRRETIREQIGLPAMPTPEGLRIIPGQVIPTPSADTADTPSASDDTVHTSSADSPDSHHGNPAERPATTTAQNTSTVPPRTGSGAGNPADRNRRGPRTALIIAACLTLLASGGALLLSQKKADTGDVTSSASPSPSKTPSADPSPSKTLEDIALKRLQEAKKKGGRPWRVGVKREQKGLSEEKNGEWVGAEIDYAKRILHALGLKEGQYEFRGVGTLMRAKELNARRVDMFIGTYGISEERKKGTKEEPAVIFAGPYFETAQKIMLEKYQGPNSSEEAARIRGRRKPVHSISDLPRNTRVCVVDGSTAETYLRGEGKKYNLKIEEDPTDYKECISGLKAKFDAVMTDEAILRQFWNDNKDDFIIADERFGGIERYGIGLNKNDSAFRKKLCTVMKEVEKDRDKIYGPLSGDKWEQAPDMTECPSS